MCSPKFPLNSPFDYTILWAEFIQGIQAKTHNSGLNQVVVVSVFIVRVPSP
jgi:hypothetical protein